MLADLIVTYDPTHPGKAKTEAQALIEDVHEKPQFLDSEVEGIFLIYVKEPKITVKRLLDLCREDPERFEHTFKWMPVDKWYDSNIDDMSDAIQQLEPHIGNDEKWKLYLTKRKYEKYSTTDLI